MAAENIAITFDQTLNSTGEILGLIDGKWDIAFDNGDNVVAWDEGQGADGKPHDLFIFLGGSQELNQLVAQCRGCLLDGLSAQVGDQTGDHSDIGREHFRGAHANCNSVG